MASAPAKEIVWIDCEMTGLDIEKDKLCELAIIVTDFDLKPLHKGFSVVINPGAEALNNMNDFVRSMHESSGLLKEIETGVEVETAQQQALEYVNSLVTKDRRPLVGGNTIGMDRRFISKYMPLLEERLHYRSIDVSTIKELSRRWHPKAFYEAPSKDGGHRALADITESIRELAYFRDTVMVQAPGPDTKTANGIATKITTDFADLS